MGRKRGFGSADSSDDDDVFQPSDSESSPVFSRLKRKRRSSGRERSVTPSASGDGCESRAEEGKQIEEGEVICIPDSLDEDDGQETPVSKQRALPSGANESETGDNPILEDDPADNDDEDEEAQEDAVVDDDNRSAAPNGHEAKASEKRPRRASTANASSFDQAESESESEREPSEDDGDVYKSEDDSPDESEESDFAPSPVKPTRKPKAKKKASSRQTVSKAKTAASTPVRKPLKSVSNIAKPHPVKNKEKQPVSAGSGKKRLGARIPIRPSSLGKSPGNAAQRPRPSTPGQGPSTIYRAGLSRNASIPRLHSYLRKP